MHVYIPGPLRSYTAGVSRVEARGRTLDEVLVALEAAFPGIRFRIVDEQDRIRTHIKIFVNAEQQQVIDGPVTGTDEIHIICALSGGSSDFDSRTPAG
jgi:molybdopterin synthase sulfur carrier subunit